jgi:hypothetical protein
MELPRNLTSFYCSLKIRGCLVQVLKGVFFVMKSGDYGEDWTKLFLNIKIDSFVDLKLESIF